MYVYFLYAFMCVYLCVCVCVLLSTSPSPISVTAGRYVDEYVPVVLGLLCANPTRVEILCPGNFHGELLCVFEVTGASENLLLKVEGTDFHVDDRTPEELQQFGVCHHVRGGRKAIVCTYTPLPSHSSRSPRLLTQFGKRSVTGNVQQLRVVPNLSTTLDTIHSALDTVVAVGMVKNSKTFLEIGVSFVKLLCPASLSMTLMAMGFLHMQTFMDERQVGAPGGTQGTPTLENLIVHKPAKLKHKTEDDMHTADFLEVVDTRVEDMRAFQIQYSHLLSEVRHPPCIFSEEEAMGSGLEASLFLLL